jgi:hypothetical membrane protein
VRHSIHALARWARSCPVKPRAKATGTGKPDCSPADRVTRSLLGYGVLAGPLYIGSALVQGLTRPGFNLLRDDVSLLSNGSLGWIQVLTFVVTGSMVIAFALGVARAVRSGRGHTWAARLVGIYGLGLFLAGVFVADPMNGFPPGTPDGRPAVISLHGMLHIIVGGIAFLALVAACVVIGSRFASQGRRAWALYSYASGIVFLLGFIGVASGSGSTAIVLGFWLAVIVAWTWIAAYAVYLYRGVGSHHAV